MNSLSSPYFKLLKIKLLNKAGIIDIAPSDCKAISLKITHETRQVISETTIKRIFGFALSKFNPSQYTVDVLAKYCGYAGWRDLCEKEALTSTLSSPVEIDLQKLKAEAEKITGFTLKALKNRSGIPFNQTISRRFFDSHMEAFKSSGCMGTIFAAPAGYGKSTALCHWVEHQQQVNFDEANNDIILFFSSHALMSLLHSGKGLMDWFLALLGYSTEITIGALRNLFSKGGYKFYLIIDGFDPLFLKKEEFAALLNQLGDIFSLSEGFDFLRVVLTMRTATWINYRIEWEGQKYSWFNTLNKGNDYINFPKLNIAEIAELRTNINAVDTSPISIKASGAINHPLHFQYFYKLNKADFSLKYLDSNSCYEIVSAFISAKIYTCPNAISKMEFINAVISELDFQQASVYVDKLKISNLIKHNACTYHDLISIGILREINRSDATRYQNHIIFTDPVVLGHFVAEYLLFQGGGRFDMDAVNRLNGSLKDNSLQITVLKWFVIDAVKNGRFQDLHNLQEVDIDTVKKAELISFLGDLLRREASLSVPKGELFNMFKGDAGSVFFNYFFGLEFICIEYKTTLQTLLKFNLSVKQRIQLLTALATIAVIQLDMKELELVIAQMAALPADEYYALALDPLNCLDAIYHYFKFGFIKRSALVELTKTAFGLGGPMATRYENCATTDILFLLAIYTLWLTDNPKKVLRFINIIDRDYQANGAAKGSNYDFFSAMLKADAHFKLNHKAEVKAWYNLICAAYEKAEGSMTPFMKALFFSLKIKLFINKNTSNSILNDLRSVNTVTEDSGNKFTRIYILMMLLKNHTFLSDDPDFRKQAGYDYNMILSRSGIVRDCFQI